MAPSSSSASAGASHAGLAIAATAMALSGTLVLYSLCRTNKQPHLVPAASDTDAAGSPSSPRLRPCLSSSEKRKKREKARQGSKKRVRFAADVVDNGAASVSSSPRTAAAAARREEAEPSCAVAAMPANREALYRGMLRGRSMLRVACSY